uniref:NADH-ubiquinone oxidoreductase chain 3 n=1 Tax=Oltmannsiellopsis viridis TaxID=51324 RepID=Q0QIQ6_OLTVI|nr:NADH dehydrogenase subunit 3 [Oltmannsiellopsis viridis]ABC96347.1 NADH dehydrogenase subunit 3 [Oltmannsiellopsis viridis]
MSDYLNIFVYLCFSSVLSLLISSLAFVTAVRKPDPEKLSAYECGFDPFDSARTQFDIHFYLVAILFIIFDLEITFLFPWCITLGQIGMEGFFVMMVFLIILTIGFIYEWLKTALEFSDANTSNMS